MIARALYTLTARLPCRLINLDGRRYLERYWVGRLFGWTFYLHRFVAGDDERDVHDHPWHRAVSVILCGGYTEERLLAFCPDHGWLSDYHRLRAGSVNIIGSRDFHRVTQPRPETWTLFCHGPRVKSWGFLSRYRDKRAVLYHQHLDTDASIGWQLHAPAGRYADRMPFGATHAPAPFAAR